MRCSMSQTSKMARPTHGSIFSYIFWRIMAKLHLLNFIKPSNKGEIFDDMVAYNR